ncbi:hypothetical protein BKI52_17600 [marine bacterium AO1-C]|nr:hypothetical protein BKI52_17600 [marine bacterium AO1-C]
MKRSLLTFLTLLFLGLGTFTHAQKIGEIKKRSGDNRSSNRSSRGSSGSGCGDAGSGCAGDFLGSVCSNISASVCSSVITEVLSQSFSRRNAGGGTYIPLSFEIGGDATFVPTNQNLYRPRARFRIGVLSLEYRYTYLTEQVLGSRQDFPTHEIQFIQINPILDPGFDLRLGWGLYIEQESLSNNATHNEFTFGFDAFPARMKLGSEFRLVTNSDRNNNISPRWEVNAQVKYAVLNNPNNKIYIGLSGSYAEYYAVSIWGIGLGVNFKFGQL